MLIVFFFLYVYFEDIAGIMAKSRNWDELQYVWTEWRRRSGAPMRDLYQQLVTLNNDAAKLNSKFSYRK